MYIGRSEGLNPASFWSKSGWCVSSRTGPLAESQKWCKPLWTLWALGDLQIKGNGQAPPWLQPKRWRLHVIDAVMIFRENIRPEWEVPAGGVDVVAFLRHGEDI